MRWWKVTGRRVTHSSGKPETAGRSGRAGTQITSPRILVDDETLFEFYDQRISHDVSLRATSIAGGKKSAAKRLISQL